MRTTVWAFREIYSLPVVISTNFVLLCFLFSCFVLLWRLVRQGSFVEISWQSSGSSVCQLTQELQALVFKPSNPGSRSYETTSHSFLPDIAYTLLQVEWLATWLISVAKSFRGHDFGRKRKKCEWLIRHRSLPGGKIVYKTRWWLQIFVIFNPTRGNDPIWLIFFKWVETTR